MLEIWEKFNLRLFPSLHGFYRKSQLLNGITWIFPVPIFTEFVKIIESTGIN